MYKNKIKKNKKKNSIYSHTKHREKKTEKKHSFVIDGECNEWSYF